MRILRVESPSKMCLKKAERYPYTSKELFMEQHIDLLNSKDKSGYVRISKDN